MFATGFQSFAFQTVGAANDNLGGGGNVYHHHHPYEELKEKVRKERSALQKLESVLKETERKKELAAKNKIIAKQNKSKQATIRLAALENEYLQEIIRLLAVRAELIQRIKEDEAILVIMMMKRRRLRAA